LASSLLSPRRAFGKRRRNPSKQNPNLVKKWKLPAQKSNPDLVRDFVAFAFRPGSLKSFGTRNPLEALQKFLVLFASTE
jgi:hypothetical protein